MTRLKDFSPSAVANRSLRNRHLLSTLSYRRFLLPTSPLTSNLTISFIAYNYLLSRNDNINVLRRKNRISNIDFSFNFNAFSDVDCLIHFRFRKQDLVRVTRVIGWPEGKRRTKKNRYFTTPLLSTCIVLRRLATPARWRDLELLFGKHGPQLSEIFWEALEHLLEAMGHLITAPIDEAFLHSRIGEYASAVHLKSAALGNCIGFIDGTVLGIARPKGNLPQKVVYNGHKRKRSLKYQALNKPDGLIQHICGPIEGRRHDWTLYIRSGLDDSLPLVLEVAGKRYCIYRDSGYSWRWFLEVPFQGANLSAAQKAFNKAMSAVRIKVEWIFKEIKMHLATGDFKRKMKILESPVGMLYTSSMLLSNFRNFVYPNQISKYF